MTFLLVTYPDIYPELRQSESSPDQRRERSPILVTTNLPFDEWTEMFGSEHGEADRGPAGQADPPRTHPGDERRELQAQTEQAAAAMLSSD